MDDNRLQEEARFADLEYLRLSTTPEELHFNPAEFSKYTSPKQMWDWRQRAGRLLGDLRGKDVLDYGCGAGGESVYLAKLGGNVKAIDISPEGVRITRERARREGVSDRVDARVMNATPTEFPAESFDVVHGLGILHHVGLTEGLAEIRRLLRPGGAGVFLEPLGSSGTVEALKRAVHRRVAGKLDLIPVTSGEENLRFADIRRECGKFFSHRVYPYRLTYRVRKLLLMPRRTWPLLLRLDHALLAAVPPLRRFAGAAVIHVVK